MPASPRPPFSPGNSSPATPPRRCTPTSSHPRWCCLTRMPTRRSPNWPHLHHSTTPGLLSESKAPKAYLSSTPVRQRSRRSRISSKTGAATASANTRGLTAPRFPNRSKWGSGPLASVKWSDGETFDGYRPVEEARLLQVGRAGSVERPPRALGELASVSTTRISSGSCAI